MKIFNLFRRKPKYIVCLDLSELPDKMNIDDWMSHYKKDGVMFLNSFSNINGTKKPLNSHIIKV